MSHDRSFINKPILSRRAEKCRKATAESVRTPGLTLRAPPRRGPRCNRHACRCPPRNPTNNLGNWPKRGPAPRICRWSAWCSHLKTTSLILTTSMIYITASARLPATTASAPPKGTAGPCIAHVTAVATALISNPLPVKALLPAFCQLCL